MWPISYFRATTAWILRQRRTVSSRVSTISAEINKIGEVVVFYRKQEDPFGNVVATEERIGLSVTPGSTVEKLMMAYIANGGNPFDISSFMYPTSQLVEVNDNGEITTKDSFHGSGVLFPMSSEIDDGGKTGYEMSSAGQINSRSYFPLRQEAKVSNGSFDYDAVTKTMKNITKWASQDIKETLLEIEQRIIKQCDLREQLTKERDEVLVQAFGGSLYGVGDIDPERFDSNLMVQNMVQDMSETVMELDENGGVLSASHRTDAYIPFAFPSVPADYNADMSV